MADNGSPDFLLPAAAYVLPPKVTKANVVASTDFNPKLVAAQLLDIDSLEGQLAVARFNGRKCGGRARAATLRRIIKRSIRPIVEDKDTMINVNNLCALLSENVSEAVSDWIVFTAKGTLLGYSADTTIKQARKLAALIGAEWRVHDSAINSDIKEIHSGSQFVAHVETFPYEHAGGGLRCMHGEASDMMIVAHHIKGPLLVAAMISLEEPGSSSVDNIIERIESLQIFQKTESAASVDDTTEAANHDSRPLKRDILMLQAEGMVDVLREDLRDFTFPKYFQ